MKKIRLDTRGVLGLCGLAVSVYWYVSALSFPASTFDGTPGAGFFPKILAVVMAILSIAMIIKSIASPEVLMGFKTMEKATLIKLIAVVPACIVFLLLWKYVSFVPAFAVLMFGLSLLLGMKWWKGLLFSAIFTALVYTLFTVVLQVILRI